MEEKEDIEKKPETPLTLLLKSPQKNAVPSIQIPQPSTSSAILPVLPPSLPSALETRPSITIYNTVSTMDLGCTVDLCKLSTWTRNSEFNPRRFRGLVMRILEPKSTALIFNTGKIVINGARCEKTAHIAALKFAKIVQKVGFKVRATNFQVRNIVGMCDVRFPIKVDAINQVHTQFCSYEPELFPALFYRVVKPRVVVLIFVNGKIILTGGKTRDELHEALDLLLPILKSFRKQ